jgi:hypothetical protein
MEKLGEQKQPITFKGNLEKALGKVFVKATHVQLCGHGFTETA